MSAADVLEDGLWTAQKMARAIRVPRLSTEDQDRWHQARILAVRPTNFDADVRSARDVPMDECKQSRLTVSQSGIVTRLSTTCLMEHVMGCTIMTSQVQDVLKADGGDE